MEDRYDCPECGYTLTKPGFCPNCKASLVATCPACGNPIVGEQIQLAD